MDPHAKLYLMQKDLWFEKGYELEPNVTTISLATMAWVQLTSKWAVRQSSVDQGTPQSHIRANKRCKQEF